MSMVSTQRVLEAIQYYQGLGYQPLDVPLVVDGVVSSHTKPKGVPELSHDNGKVYVASAEQSFLQLHKEGNLPDGKYQALTPCYRHERFVSDTHYLMFLKLELIVVGDCGCGYDLTESVCKDAKGFYSKYTTCESFWLAEEPIMDINSKGVELGSYGYRAMLDETPYVFGTGLAEPRLSYVMGK